MANKGMEKLLQGFAKGFIPQVDAANKSKRDAAQRQADLENNMKLAEFLRSKYPRSNVRIGDVSLDDRPVPNMGLPVLTPAQEAAEKVAGKQIADYSAAGGKAAMDKNLAQVAEVQRELEAGKRGKWDRFIGSTTNSMPGLMGLLGSSEKSRRDRARNAAISIARSTDPNPTEKQIADIFGQIYDPASTDEDNLLRLRRFQEQQQQESAARENALQRYRQTGYATLGGPAQQMNPGFAPPSAAPLGSQSPVPQASPAQQDPAAARRARIAELRAKLGRQ